MRKNSSREAKSQEVITLEKSLEMITLEMITLAEDSKEVT